MCFYWSTRAHQMIRRAFRRTPSGMAHLHAPLTMALLGVLTLGCNSRLDGKGAKGGGDDSGSGGGGPTLTEEQDPFGIGCDIQTIMAKPENGCTNAGCHGARPEAGLDLLSAGVEQRLVGVPSTGEACGGDPLVNPEDPGNSLLLRKIDPARFSLGGETCGGIMPLNSMGVGGEDLQCFEKWVLAMGEATEPDAVVSFAADWEDVSVESYLAKVKALTNGDIVSTAELEGVKADPAALRALVEQWVETPGYEAKVYDFLQVALQQRLGNYVRLQQLTEQADTLSILGNYRNELHVNAMASFTRTAQKIVLEERPFTEILTTRNWEMTTALLILLAYTELDDDEKKSMAHYVYKDDVPEGAPATPTLAQSIDTGFWYNPNRGDNCTANRLRGDNLFDYIFGRFSCAKGDENPTATDDDFSDWRTVELVPAKNDAERERFWDFITLRAANQLHVTLPRTGFFTTPAFLGNWQTNEDNQFRVTASQTMITALGKEFTAGDLTAPLTLSGLDAVHSEPGTSCYSCHTLLDPMRNYFTQSFDFTYQRSTTPSNLEAGFAFRGTAMMGGDGYDFAQRIAEHPNFASAWVQKLCYYANSQACDENDPEFIRIVTAFESTGFNLKSLYVDLFSSALVTGASYTETYDSRRWLISITRQNHLCRLLDEHLGYENVCAEGSSFIGLIPDDEFARGQAAPVQTAVTSSFHFAAADALCDRLSIRLVGGSSLPFNSQEVDASLALMVDGLLGLPEGHSRRQRWIEALARHHQGARDAGANANVAMRSTFTLACTSPEIMAMGL